MVESEIPDGGEGLPKSNKCTRSSYQGPSDDVPVMMDCSRDMSNLSAP